ncbi:hypothetical protein M9H77_02773 [Catharanthus roseus]|uniref:Uncharacterized protein n=1 Tax=Catharanthus roseus TaxID=4058 RepID=A0ACC0C9C3_CATRO|nr:hypothetical protein M9H77_02773 [Catharanthus roseus]
MGLYELEKLERELKNNLLSVWASKVARPPGSHLANSPPPTICFGYNPTDQKRQTVSKENFQSPNAIGVEYGYYSNKELYSEARVSTIALSRGAKTTRQLWQEGPRCLVPRAKQQQTQQQQMALGRGRPLVPSSVRTSGPSQAILGP